MQKSPEIHHTWCSKPKAYNWIGFQGQNGGRRGRSKRPVASEPSGLDDGCDSTVAKRGRGRNGPKNPGTANNLKQSEASYGNGISSTRGRGRGRGRGSRGAGSSRGGASGLVPAGAAKPVSKSFFAFNWLKCSCPDFWPCKAI